MNRLQTQTPPSAIEFSRDGHYFTAVATDTELDGVIQSIQRPLSVIYQVTRRCNFDCDFCSETARVKDPTLDEIARIQRNLCGVQRVFLSGGEPLLRKDFIEIVSIFGEHIIGVPTNATRGHGLADQLAGRVAFVNIGLEGPRSTTNRVRGDYDKVMRGVDRFRAAGLSLSVSAVVMRSFLDALPFTYQIADVIGAGKLKLIHPIRKGNGLHMADSEFLSLDESAALFERLSELRMTHGGRGRSTEDWPTAESKAAQRTRSPIWATYAKSRSRRSGVATPSSETMSANTSAAASPCSTRPRVDARRK